MQVAYADGTSARAYAAATVPTLVVHGELAHHAVRRSNELVARALRNADLVYVADAGHFMIATHPANVAALVEAHAIAAADAAPLYRWRSGVAVGRDPEGGKAIGGN